jgi:dephospho-CoA kinase
MRVLGLTGSIGMGKTTAAGMLRQDRLPVHDADAAVHRLLARGGAGVAAVEAAFPGVRRADGAIDRPALAARVFGNREALRRLEAILHPLARAEMLRFLKRMRRQRRPVVVLDVPLLFETGGERWCDAVAVVSASPLIQRQRVMRRPGMTEARFRAILARQMPDREKRRRADYVIPTGLGRGPTRAALRRAVAALGSKGR